MVANLNHGSYTVGFLQRLIFCIIAMRYIFILIRITFQNATCLLKFKQKNNTFTWFSEVYQLRLPLKEYVKLFNFIPPSESLIDNYDDRRYKFIYDRLCNFSKSSIDVIDALKARELQATLMRHAFKKLLDLSLSDNQAYILAFSPNVSVTIKIFLEWCGCPTIPIKYEDLERYLPIFIEQSSITEHKLLSRKEYILILEKRSHLLNTWWLRIRSESLQIYWEWVDRVEQKEYKLKIEKSNKQITRKTFEKIYHMYLRKQRWTFAILVFNIQVKTLFTLVNSSSNVPDSIFNEAFERIIQNQKTFNNI